MKQTKMGKDTCPKCGELLNAATSMGDHVPSPGDFSICFYCTAWLKYGPDMALESITKLDLQSMDKDLVTELYKLTQAIKK